MKNTLIPLDMIFIDENQTIVNIETAFPCRNDPCPSYLSVRPAQFVLEINAGLAKANNITAGNKVWIKVE